MISRSLKKAGWPLLLALSLAWGPAASRAQAPGSKAYTVAISGKKDNFTSEVLKSKLPVLADVGATWCVPCRALAPIVDGLAKEYAGRVKVVTVDADENPDLVDRLKVEGFPTLFFFKNGKIVGTEVGVLSEQDLRSRIEHLLKPAPKAAF